MKYEPKGEVYYAYLQSGYAVKVDIVKNRLTGDPLCFLVFENELRDIAYQTVISYNTLYLLYDAFCGIAEWDKERCLAAIPGSDMDSLDREFWLSIDTADGAIDEIEYAIQLENNKVCTLSRDPGTIPVLWKFYNFGYVNGVEFNDCEFSILLYLDDMNCLAYGVFEIIINNFERFGLSWLNCNNH